MLHFVGKSMNFNRFPQYQYFHPKWMNAILMVVHSMQNVLLYNLDGFVSFFAELQMWIIFHGIIISILLCSLAVMITPLCKKKTKMFDKNVEFAKNGISVTKCSTSSNGTVIGLISWFSSVWHLVKRCESCLKFIRLCAFKYFL